MEAGRNSPESDAPQELEARIGRRLSQRGAARPAPRGDLDERAEVAARLRDTWHAAEPLNETALWNKIAVGLRSDRSASRRWAGWLGALGAWGASSGRVRRLASGVAMAVAVAITAGVLIATGGQAEASFIEHVAELSAAVDQAASDGSLSETEREAIREHTLDLLQEAETDGEAQALTSAERASVLATLGAVVTVLDDLGSGQGADEDLLGPVLALANVVADLPDGDAGSSDDRPGDSADPGSAGDAANDDHQGDAVEAGSAGDAANDDDDGSQ